MILRLRHAVPFLQNVNTWATCVPAQPLTRHLARAAAAAANSAPEDQPESSDASATQSPAAERKTPRRSPSSKAKTEPVVLEPEAPAVPDAANEASTSQPAAPKRRTSSLRKATGTSSAEDQPQVTHDGTTAAAARSEAPAPPRPTRRKKSAEEPSAEDLGASASESSSKSSPKERSNNKKTAARDELVAETPPEANLLLSLPYEDCLVLPRKAEKLLEALGIRRQPSPRNPQPLPQPPPHPSAATATSTPAAGSPPPSPLGGPPAGPLRNVQELAHFLGWRAAKDLALPLLLAQYQGYLGESPDYLYDMFLLDFYPPSLPSDAIRDAAVLAARNARAVLSAKGESSEPLARAALQKLRDRVGPEAVEAQERRHPGLTEAQLELFLLDWASASRAGVEQGHAIPYVARRCAALLLTRPVVLERLHRYTVQGASLQELAVASGRGGRADRAVKLTQPLDALLEGLKAGVRLDRERLLWDFRLGPGEPLHSHVPALQAAVNDAALVSADPGSQFFYANLYDKLRVQPEVKKGMQEQERRWQAEQGERDGSAIATAQLRLLFHLGRLDRYRLEKQRRRQRAAS